MAAEVGNGLVRKAIFAALLALFAAPVQAQTVAGWETFESDGEMCGVGSDYEGDGETRLIVTINLEDRVALLASNYNWSAKEGEKYEGIEYILNGSSFGGGVAVGIETDLRKGFVTTFPVTFLNDFAAGTSLHIYKGDKAIDRLNLKGSGAAVAHLRRCIARLKAVRAAENREKAKFADIPKDPFAEEGK